MGGKILCNLLFMGRGFSFHGGRWVFFLMCQSLYQPADKCQSKASSPALSGGGTGGVEVWRTTPEDLGDNRTMSLTRYTVSVWSPHRLAQALFGTRLIAARNVRIPSFFFFFFLLWTSNLSHSFFLGLGEEVGGGGSVQISALCRHIHSEGNFFSSS